MPGSKHKIPTILPESVRSFLKVYTSPTARCVCCNEEKAVSEVLRDGVGQFSCREHGLRICHSCGRFMVSGAVELQGYEPVCEDCSRGLGVREIRTLTAKVRDFLDSEGFIIPAVNMQPLPAAEMARRNKTILGHAPLGVAHNDREPYTIEIMRQQSKAGLIRTIAHEMMHLWLYENKCKAPAIYAEGFCNLCAALVLKKFEGVDILYHLGSMMEDKNVKYGVGFRRLLAVYYNFGLNAVVAVMREYMDA